MLIEFHASGTRVSLRISDRVVKYHIMDRLRRGDALKIVEGVYVEVETALYHPENRETEVIGVLLIDGMGTINTQSNREQVQEAAKKGYYGTDRNKDQGVS